MGLRRNLAALMAFVSVGVACGGNSIDDVPTATVPEAVTTTTAADPYAVPAVIDAAYVNRVLAGLDAAVGEVVRLVVRTRSFPPEAYERLKAVYADPDALQLEIDGFQIDLSQGLAGLRPDPGLELTTVTRLISAQPACVFAEVERDRSALRSQPGVYRTTLWVALRSVDASVNNRTRWAFIYNGFQPDRSQPPDPCVAAS